MEFEVPTAFATVTAREAILLSTVCPVGTVPWNVKGMFKVNWPPNAREAVLPNQTVETGCTLTVNCVTGILKPGAVVNWTFHDVRLRVVVKPVTEIVTLLVVWPVN